MTIQLKDPIFIAGVHQAAGASLTLGADVEAELVNRGVAVYVGEDPSEGGLVPVLSNRAGTAIIHSLTGQALLSFDAEGNMIANVNHRRDTLAALLALVGGAGEIAVVSNYRAFVVYNQAGIGVVYGATAPMKRAIGTWVETPLTCTNGAAAGVVPIEQPFIGSDAYDVDTVNYCVSGVPGGGLNKAVLYEVEAQVEFSANATGTRTVELQRATAATGPWTTVKTKTVAAAASGTTLVDMPKHFEGSGVSTSDVFFRLRASSVGATVAATANILCVSTTPISNSAAA